MVLSAVAMVAGWCVVEGAASSLAYYDEEGRWLEPRTDERGDPLVLNYSYAGYGFGEKPVPEVAGPVFDVTDYGAVPDDGNDDTIGVQRAIDAAEEAGGGVVFFPPGVFHFSTNLSRMRPLEIQSGNIVLRGSGSTEGGTILFKVNGRPHEWMIRFQSPQSGMGGVLTTVREDVPRNARELEVESSAPLEEGQWVVLEAGDRHAVTEVFMGSRSIRDGWTRIQDNGVPIREIHRIERIEGDRITLRAPVKLTMLESFDMRLRAFEPITEVGVEDIAFMGNWLGHFIHHRSSYDDYHFNAVSFHTAVDGWVRRCAFINLNQTLNLDTTANMTVKHTRIAGTAPHSGHLQHRSTHNLSALSQDESDGAWHNLQWRAQTAGAVFWRVDMHPVMPIDVHGMYPYGSLLDAVSGGYFMDSGGPVASFPQHGPGLMVWNFDYLKGATSAQKQRRNATIDFWSGRPWIVDPIVAGLYGAAEDVGVNADSMLVLESLGSPVEPESLYEAQLKARLGELPEWVGEAKAFWESYRNQPLPEFFQPVDGPNRALHHFPGEVPLDFLAAEIQALKQMRDHPNDFDVISDPEGGFRTDFMKIKTAVFNVLAYMHSFSVGYGGGTLYANPAGPGTVTIDKEEREGGDLLIITAEYPHEEPAGYYDRFTKEKNAYRKYIGENKAQEWDGVVELVRSLGGTVRKRNVSGGSRVRLEFPEMTPSGAIPADAASIALESRPEEPLAGMPVTLTAVVVDAHGNPLPASEVTFALEAGGGSLGEPATVLTDGLGEAWISYTTAVEAETATLRASAGGATVTTEVDSLPVPAPTDLEATGGTVTTLDQGVVRYRVHTFTGTGAHEFEVSEGSGDVEVLAVGGGGGGGGSSDHRWGGAGGGAGGMIETTVPVDAGSYPVEVGSGGAGGVGAGDAGESGGNSRFMDLIALGGGPGRGQNLAYDGGSGSGGAAVTTTQEPQIGKGLQPDSPAGGWGNDGGWGTGAIGVDRAGGGGGGAGSAGGDAGPGTGGDGGDGRESAISGAPVKYAGGGGGAGRTSPGTGGDGGGGDGGLGWHGSPGAPNTGGGGGASSLGSSFSGGAGGSGIVSVRYVVEPEEAADPWTDPVVQVNRISGTDTLRLAWRGREGTVYRLQRSDDLLNWEDTGISFEGEGGELEHVETLDGSKSRFFRLIVEP